MIDFELYALYLAVAGIAAGAAALLLDAWMDYGHIFGRLRWGAAIRAVKKAGDDTLLQELEGIRTGETRGIMFGDRLNRASDLYWTLATQAPGFTAWVCVICMSGRLSLIAAALMAGLFYAREGNAWYFAWAAPGVLLTAAAAFVTIKLVDR